MMGHHRKSRGDCRFDLRFVVPKVQEGDSVVAVCSCGCGADGAKIDPSRVMPKKLGPRELPKVSDLSVIKSSFLPSLLLSVLPTRLGGEASEETLGRHGLE